MRFNVFALWTGKNPSAPFTDGDGGHLAGSDGGAVEADCASDVTAVREIPPDYNWIAVGAVPSDVPPPMARKRLDGGGGAGG